MHTLRGVGAVLLNLSAIFVLHSLISRDWYRATSRRRIILVSSHVSTFASLVQSQIKVSNHLRFYSFRVNRWADCVLRPWHLLWEPYPSYHNGLFSPLLVREISLPEGRSVSVLSEQFQTSYLFYVILSFLCNIICYLISVCVCFH